MRYLAVESRIVSTGQAGIELLRKAGATKEELRYAEFLAKKLAGRMDRYINPSWRKTYAVDSVR